MTKKILTFLFYVFCLLGENVNAKQETDKRVIVFDFGGVIAQANTVQMTDFLTKTFGIDKEELSNALRSMQCFVTSGGSEQQFWQQYAFSKEIVLPSDWFKQFGAVIKRSITEIPETVAFVRSLQNEGYQTSMLSDVTQYQAEIIRKMGYYDLFNPVLLSFETGVKKPNPEAFKILLQKLQLPAYCVVFIDDRNENVEAAKKQGIDAILFINPTQLKEELEKRGIQLEHHQS